ncbi:hypothetical protein HYS28_00135 [Candidatus Uhrbacteria bacterium]|nr:hypothetical protein [Candidatus Uhrbacteria bacterium]
MNARTVSIDYLIGRRIAALPDLTHLDPEDVGDTQRARIEEIVEDVQSEHEITVDEDDESAFDCW